MKSAVSEIEHIKEMLPRLSKPALQEAKDFVQYLLSKQKKRKAFIDRVLKAEHDPYTECHTVEEVMRAIRNAPCDEDD